MSHEPWHFETDQEVDRVVLDGERVYVATSGADEFPTVQAINRGDATATWTEQISSATAVRQLVVTDGTVYLQTEYTHYGGEETIRTFALDATTGMEKWSFDRRRREIDGPLMTELEVHDGHPYIAAVHEDHDESYCVYIPDESHCVELEGRPTSPPKPGETEQSGEWVAMGVGGFEHRLWGSTPVSYFAGRDPDIIDPVFEDYGHAEDPAEGSARALCWDDGRLFAGTESHVYAFEPGFADGPVLEVSTSGAVKSFRVAGETLYALTSDGVIAVDIREIRHRNDRERHLWSAGDGTVRDVVVGDDAVYLTVASRLYAVDATDGDGRWVFEADSQVRCAEGIFEGRLYAAAGESIFAIDASTGEVVAETAVESRARNSPGPVFADGLLHLGTADGVYAIQPVDRNGGIEFATVPSGSGSEAGTEDEATAEDTPEGTCPECGTELTGDENFCPTCGHNLASTCPNCSTELDGGENFCPACGHDVSG